MASQENYMARSTQNQQWPSYYGWLLYRSSDRKNGCPQKVRVDHGTENTHVLVMQKFLHDSADENDTDGVTLGPSTGN